MRHGISQYDITDRLLRVANAKPRAGTRKDIGEAKITHTIFGRARVRVIREKDKTRLAWLLAALAATAMLAAAWLGWTAAQRSELLQNAATPALPSVSIKLITPPNGNNLPATRESALQQLPGSKESERVADRPATPLAESKRHRVSNVTTNNSAPSPLGLQSFPGLPATGQSATPPVAISPAAQAVEINPAVGGPLVQPMLKKDIPTISPAGDNLPAVPVNTHNPEP